MKPETKRHPARRDPRRITQIREIIIVIGMMGLMVVGAIYLPSLGRNLIALLPASLPKQPQIDTFKAEIIKSVSAEPDEITEEYHLWLKVSFWNKAGEKILPPLGRLIINGFMPPSGVLSDTKQIIMTQGIKRIIELDKVSKDEGNTSLNPLLIEGTSRLEGSDILIHLKSGIKLQTGRYYLSLTVEYEPPITQLNEPIRRLTQNISLYQY